MYSGPTKKMLELADFLEKFSPPVEMESWITVKDDNEFYVDGRVLTPRDRSRIKADVIKNGNECGTACCIAGWTAVRWGTSKHAGEKISKFAMEKLGIDDEVADALFYPHRFESELSPVVQRERAVQVLRGEVELDRNWLHSPTKRK